MASRVGTTTPRKVESFLVPDRGALSRRGVPLLVGSSVFSGQIMRGLRSSIPSSKELSSVRLITSPSCDPRPSWVGVALTPSWLPCLRGSQQTGAAMRPALRAIHLQCVVEGSEQRDRSQGLSEQEMHFSCCQPGIVPSRKVCWCQLSASLHCTLTAPPQYTGKGQVCTQVAGEQYYFQWQDKQLCAKSTHEKVRPKKK